MESRALPRGEKGEKEYDIGKTWTVDGNIFWKTDNHR